MSATFVERLGIGDGDDIDFVVEVEQAFGVQFDRTGPIQFDTVDQLTCAIAARLSVVERAGYCATSMTFYRLRRAIESEFGVSPRPGTPLSEVLPKAHRRAAKALAVRSGLRVVDPPLGWQGMIGCLVMALALIAFLFWPGGWLGLATGSAMIAFGVLLARLDPGHYAYRDFGDLVRDTAALNVGRLIHEGADSRRPAIEAAVTRLAAQWSSVGVDRIGPDTRLWPTQARRVG